MPVIQPRPPLIPGGTSLLQHAVYQRLHLQVLVNTFYTLVSQANPDGATLADAAQKFWEHVSPQWIQVVTAELIFSQVITRVMGRPEIPSVIYPIPGTVAGVQPGEALPTTVAAVITRRSSWGGKRGRGRIYIGGISEGAQNLSVITAGHRPVVQAFADRLLVDPFLGDFGRQTNYHWSKNKGTEAGVAGAPLTAVTVQLTFGTQRRRRLGRGI